MRLAIRSVGLVLTLSATALAFGRSESRATNDLGGRMSPSVLRSDLDDYDDARLMRDLWDELNDVLDEVEDDDTDAETLAGLILAAYGDDGDSGYETDITLADLEEEMSEANTSLEQVIARALGIGVGAAGGPASTSPGPMILHASRADDEMQTKNPRTTSRLVSVRRGTFDAIRRVKPSGSRRNTGA